MHHRLKGAIVLQLHYKLASLNYLILRFHLRTK